MRSAAKPGRQVDRKRRAARTRRVLWVGLAILALSVAWLVVSNPLPPAGKFLTNSPVPNVTLSTKQGEVRLSDLEGEVVALYFSFVG